MYSQYMTDTRKKKLHIRMIEDGELKWVYMCEVPRQIFAEFLNVTNTKMREFGVFLALWGNPEFDSKLEMIESKDLYRLKRMIVTKYRSLHRELFDLEVYSIVPDKDLFVSIWVTQHLIETIKIAEKRKRRNKGNGKKDK